MMTDLQRMKRCGVCRWNSHECTKHEISIPYHRFFAFAFPTVFPITLLAVLPTPARVRLAGGAARTGTGSSTVSISSSASSILRLVVTLREVPTSISAPSNIDLAIGLGFNDAIEPFAELRETIEEAGDALMDVDLRSLFV